MPKLAMPSPDTWTRATPQLLFPGHTDPVSETRGLPGRPPTAHAAVLRALRAGAITVDDVRRQLGWQRRSRARVRASLAWLVSRGWVEECWRPRGEVVAEVVGYPQPEHGVKSQG